MNTEKIVDSTVEMLHANTDKRKHIADSIGVSREWLYKFASYEISGPDIHKVGRLYNYLTSQLSKPA